MNEQLKKKDDIIENKDIYLKELQ